MHIARHLFRGLVILAVVVAVAVGAGAALTETPWFKDQIRRYIQREADQYLNARVTIGGVAGTVWTGIELEHVDVSISGRQVLAVRRVAVSYNLLNIVTRGVSIDRLSLTSPSLHLWQDGGAWNVGRVVRQQAREADRSGPGRPFAIDDIEIEDGTLTIDGPRESDRIRMPSRLTRVAARLAFHYEPVRYAVTIARASFEGAEPELALTALSGGVAVKDDSIVVDRVSIHTGETSLFVDGSVEHYSSAPVFDLRVKSDALSIPELARVLPSLAGVPLRPAVDIALAGPMRRLETHVEVRSSAGDMKAALVADLVAPSQALTGDVSLRRVDLARLLSRAAATTNLTADAQLDIRGPSLLDWPSLAGDLKLSALRLEAAGYAVEDVAAQVHAEGRHLRIETSAAGYGATATAAGGVLLPAAGDADFVRNIEYDIHGLVRHLDVRRLPQTARMPRPATDINAAYHVRGARGTAVAEARLDNSQIAGAHIAAGGTAGLSMARRDDIRYRFEGDVADVNVRQVGEELGVAALSSARYTSAIAAHLNVAGRGTDVKTLNLTVAGMVVDSSMLGGHVPGMAVAGTLAGDVLRVTADGSFSDLDPAVASDRSTLKGRLNGNLRIDATIAGVSQGVVPEGITVSANVDLAPSAIGDLRITRASLDGDYRDATLLLRALDVSSPDVSLSAVGTVALDDTGHSDLTVHVDSSHLLAVAALAGQSVGGIATIDAKVTGNRQLFHAEGTIAGNEIAYGGSSALVVASEFSADVPNLRTVDTRVEAKSRAMFVSVGGWQANEVTAQTGYANRQLRFDATARDPARSVSATGSLRIDPHSQRIRLERLVVDAQNARWQTPAGVTPVVQYGDAAIEVENVALVNGDQRIEANGRFGRPGDRLTVTLSHVDVAAAEALLLRPPQFAGLLDASGVVTGSMAEPHGEARFTVSPGSFRQFTYQSFSGSGTYDGKGITLDATLAQAPDARLTLAGYAPLALFTRSHTRQGAAQAHGSAVSPSDRIDLRLDSTAVDLGVVQGLTTVASKVTGTLEAHVHVTGSAADPHPLGSLAIHKGAFFLQQTGVGYTNVEGAIAFQQDQIHIDQITVLDNQQSALTITGDLATHEGQLGRVQLYVNADDFKVVDNEMGRVRINSSLQLAGELGAPRVGGDLGVSTGTINLDPILSSMGESPYPTTEAAEQRSLFDTLSLDVRVAIPKDLIVKASDVRTPGSPIGLGAMNVTVGGDLRAVKEPGQPLRVSGTVNAARGFYDFQGRRFDILRDSVVRFDGGVRFTPTLDIRAQRLIQGVTANVNLRGTLDKPEVILTSAPPLEPADVLALIVFNQPINQLGEGQQVSIAQRAGAVAAGAVASELSRSLEDALKLSEFSISTAPEGSGLAQLTAGQQIGRNLYIRVKQGIGDQSQTNVILEYELAKWLRLQTNVLQGATTQQLFQRTEGSGIDLLFFFSY